MVNLDSNFAQGKGSVRRILKFPYTTAAVFTVLLSGCLTAHAELYASSISGSTVIPEIPGDLTGRTTEDQRVVSGKVVDEEGNPLIAVTVRVKGTSIVAQTSTDGTYQITVPGGTGVLVFTLVGYNLTERSVDSQSVVDVIMATSIASLEEVVVVAYGRQKKLNVTGSVSTISAADLSRTPVASTSNLLTGRMPGLVSVQRSGQPGSDAAALNIRGFGGALIIVDGVQADFNSIDANQIESVTILKDGAASIYGARAGNGVILVTTKRGKLGKPVISLNSSYSFQGITRAPRPVNAGQYAEMAREQWLQSGRPAATAPYTEEEVQKFYAGGDPQYPDTDWYSILTRNQAPQQQHNVSVRGGTENIKYFGLVGFLDQRTMWVESDAKYQRYNFQSNIDARISDELNLRFDLSGRLEDRDFSARGWGAGAQSTIWADFWTTSPASPSALPDPGKLPNTSVNSGISPANITSSRQLWGYNDNDHENLNATLSLDYRFKAIKGLSAKAFVNYLKDNGAVRTFSKTFMTYNYDYASNIYTPAATKANSSLNIQKADGRTVTTQLSANYENTFAEAHNISALLLYESMDIKSDWVRAQREGFLTNEIDQLFAGSRESMLSDGAAEEMGRASYIGRFTYDYQNRYLFETTFRADASAKFAANQRWGFFPSVSAGWRISQEPFLRESAIVDDLKIRASYGKSGNDNVGNFQYLSGYVFSDTYIYEGTRIEQGILTTGLANPNLTWEEVEISNIGVDFRLFNNKLYGELEGFYRNRTGIPGTRLATLPSTFGAALPQENINSLTNRGFELLLGTSGKASGLKWDVSGNISWTRSKWGHFEEPAYTDPDQIRINQRSNRWTDLVFGYQSDGLFTSMEEIGNLGFDQDQQGNVTLRPGDVKYIDTNHDGILDWRDQVVIGRSADPRWMLGMNTNLQYKDFDLSLLFQGALDHYVAVNLNAIDAVSPAVRYELRWTEQNNRADALEPRLGGSPLNNQMSDYRLKPASYVRLKQAAVGYSIPTQLTSRLGIQDLRLYVSGTNLLTFDQLKKFELDPEMPSGNAGLYYPQQRTISLGINLSL